LPGACSKDNRWLAKQATSFRHSMRAGRKTQSRRSDRLQDGNRRASRGRETGLSKVGVVAFSSSSDPDLGDYDDEPTVIFRQGSLLKTQRPTAIVQIVRFCFVQFIEGNR
jgi:hypothetical protein